MGYRVRRLAGHAAALLPLMAAPPAAAQESGALEGVPQVTREVFTYALASTITVQVAADAAGVLRLVRGRPGQIGVTTRAVGGIAGAGLGGSEGTELRLTAVGAERVDYLVTVPEEVRVRVRLSGRHVTKVFGTLQDIGTYVWGPG